MLLFEALATTESRIKLLGFPDYASMHRVFPEFRQKASFFISSRMKPGFGNGVMFDDHREHIIKIYWTAVHRVVKLQIRFEAFEQMQYLQSLHLANNGLVSALYISASPRVHLLICILVLVSGWYY